MITFPSQFYTLFATPHNNYIYFISLISRIYRRWKAAISGTGDILMLPPPTIFIAASREMPSGVFDASYFSLAFKMPYHFLVEPVTRMPRRITTRFTPLILMVISARCMICISARQIDAGHHAAAMPTISRHACSLLSPRVTPP